VVVVVVVSAAAVCCYSFGIVNEWAYLVGNYDFV
jgi:hypothetical protein